jgi:hypothetical protein
MPQLGKKDTSAALADNQWRITRRSQRSPCYLEPPFLRPGDVLVGVGESRYHNAKPQHTENDDDEPSEDQP